MSVAVEKANEERPSPLAQIYFLAGMGSMVVLGVILMQSAGRWALIPVLIGAAGLVFRWRAAPLILLAFLAIGQLGPAWMGTMHSHRRRPMLPLEFGLCATILVYVVCQFRLVALTIGALPRDRRRPTAKALLRPSSGPPSREIVAALTMVGVAVVSAFFVWTMTDVIPPRWNIVKPNWRLGLLAWLLAGVLVVTSAIVAHLGWRRISRDEAALYLQDTLWHETRREQRRINRWRAWGMNRRQ